MRGLRDKLDRLHRKIENRFNVMFGFVRCSDNKRADYRFMLRIGAGAGREWPNFEISLGGRGFYFGHIDWGKVETKTTKPPIIRKYHGVTVKDIWNGFVV